MILARLLAPEAFGLVATITMVISFAEIFADAGFQKYIVQHEFSSEQELNDCTNVAFWTNLGISSVLFILLVVFRDYIAAAVGSPELGLSIAVASVSIILVSFSSIQAARFRRELEFKKLFYARMGTSSLSLFITVPLAFLLRNHWALLLGTLAINLFNAVILTVMSKWRPRFYYSFAYFRSMFSFTAWSLLEALTVWVNAYVGTFIVGRVLSDYYLGIYKTSMSTVNSYMAIITAATTPVLFASLSRYQNDDESFKRVYYTFQRLTSVLLLPMGVGLFVFRELATTVLLGSQWLEAADFIGLWALISALVIVFGHYNSEVYRSKGKPKISLFCQLLHLCFLIPTLIFTVNGDFDILCTARSLVRLQSILVDFIIISAVFGFSLKRIFGNVAPALISAVLMGAVGYLLRMISPSMLWQLVSIAICVIVYFAILLIFFPKLRRELLSVPVIQKVLRKLTKK